MSLNKFSIWLDRTIPFTLYRWLCFLAVILLFFWRVLAYEGFYVICYALSIFLLNAFLSFLTPMHDPEDDLSNEVPLVHADEVSQDLISSIGTEAEFRPFQRRLPEFQFWWLSMRAAAGSFVLSWWPAMDIPVYWPILVVYFIGLTIVTMRKQIAHMIKYRYVPFDFGKMRF